MLIMIIMIGIAAFAFGFLLGDGRDTPPEPWRRVHTETSLPEQQLKEYHNFLHYDGSEQE